MGPEETTNLGGSQERWIPDPNDHARFCISATSQTVLYMIFFKLKLVLIDAISLFFCSEAPPNLSARAKKNSKGAPSFAERDYRENPHPETRAGENGG